MKPDPELEAAYAVAESADERDAIERYMDDDLRRRLNQSLADAAALLHRGGGTVHIGAMIDRSSENFRRVGYVIEYNSLLPNAPQPAEPEPVEEPVAA